MNRPRSNAILNVFDTEPTILRVHQGRLGAALFKHLVFGLRKRERCCCSPFDGRVYRAIISAGFSSLSAGTVAIRRLCSQALFPGKFLGLFSLIGGI